MTTASDVGMGVSPEQTYAAAPDLDTEANWVRQAAGWEDDQDRDYLLRHAALLDRVALNEPHHRRAAEEATAAALVLLDTDRATGPVPRHHAAETDPRGYVRQEYAYWLTSQ